MLELKGIKKDYIVADSKVHALKDINLAFRQSEFVSILGPSGCGKTTLLNIIGGLDHYTSGDLLIDGVSTKSYTDRDWDTYRNHRVGFIFQSYNLIPHQTILENVELALNISGVEKKERVKRAKQALDKVGLSGQYNKKPNQLSGGQCQRVAIARALVNDPEILLADEPTGALDSETSVQIMELIKQISKDCLVIMVTHNPELALQYSTRIIKLLDGNVLEDSNPFVSEDALAENKEHTAKKKSNKKAKLSFWSAFKLSAKNLYSKFKRTLMVCIAGSIGIIGVATVLAVSSGVQGYITSMQNDMLSGNPVTISEEAYNLTALMNASGQSLTQEALKYSVEDGYVNVDSMIDYLVARTSDLTSLKVSNEITQNYIDYINAMPQEYYSAINMLYGLNLTNNIYTDFNFTGQESLRYSLSAGLQIYTSMLNKTDYKDFAKYISSLDDSFMQAPDSADFILSQYDIISSPETSKIATNSNEIMIVVGKDTTLTDLLLAQLGYYTQEEFLEIVNNTNNPNKTEPDRISYEKLLGKTFTWYPNDVVFNDTTSIPNNPFTYNPYVNSTWTGGKDLTITAILRPKDNVSYGSLESGVYYTSSLAKEIIANSLNSKIVKYLNTLMEIDESKNSYVSSSMGGIYSGITYAYSFTYDGTTYNETGLVGSVSQTNALIGSMTGQSMPNYYTLTLRELGGCELPNKIKIYPTDFDYKDDVTKYLDKWNSDEELIVNGTTLTKQDRGEKVEYTDNLQIVINLVNSLINIVTTALVAFTALSLVVSTVMVAIITYVSVMERVKEIGVIRSLGGRKRDVSSLFIAETFIIGGISGLIGILITYGLCGIINLIVGGLSGIYTIASLSIPTALIMIAISVVLTLISGVIPAKLAAKKDPVDALRTE